MVVTYFVGADLEVACLHRPPQWVVVLELVEASLAEEHLQ